MSLSTDVRVEPAPWPLIVRDVSLGRRESADSMARREEAGERHCLNDSVSFVVFEWRR